MRERAARDDDSVRRAEEAAARADEEAARAAAEQERGWESDPSVVASWLRQNNLVLAGLIGIGLIFVQPFLTVPELTVAATVCVIGFAVSIPLLAALILVNEIERDTGRFSDSRAVAWGRPVAMLSGAVGLIAGFWEISWQAAVVLMVSGIAAGGMHAAAYARFLKRRGRGDQLASGQSEDATT